MDRIILERKQIVQITREAKDLIPSMERFLSLLESVCSVIDDADRSGKNYLTTKQVQQILNVTGRTLQTYRSLGMIEYEIIGREAFYSSDEINDFIRRRVAEKNIRKHMREFEKVYTKKQNDN